MTEPLSMQIHQFFTGDGCLKAKPAYQELGYGSLHQERNIKETGKGLELHISKLCCRETLVRPLKDFVHQIWGGPVFESVFHLEGLVASLWELGSSSHQRKKWQTHPGKKAFIFSLNLLPHPTPEEPKVRKGSGAISEVNNVFPLPAPNCWSKREDHCLISSEMGAFAWRTGERRYIYIYAYIHTYIYIYIERESCLVTKSCLTLLRTPWTVTHQALLSMGFLRQEYWSGLPFPPPT